MLSNRLFIKIHAIFYLYESYDLFVCMHVFYANYCCSLDGFKLIDDLFDLAWIDVYAL